jgi:hypothetical protein
VYVCVLALVLALAFVLALLLVLVVLVLVLLFVDFDRLDCLHCRERNLLSLPASPPRGSRESKNERVRVRERDQRMNNRIKSGRVVSQEARTSIIYNIIVAMESKLDSMAAWPQTGDNFSNGQDRPSVWLHKRNNNTIVTTVTMSRPYTMSVSRSIIEQIKKLIPPLDGTLHKGQSGQ